MCMISMYLDFRTKVIMMESDRAVKKARNPKPAWGPPNFFDPKPAQPGVDLAQPSPEKISGWARAGFFLFCPALGRPKPARWNDPVGPARLSPLRSTTTTFQIIYHHLFWINCHHSFQFNFHHSFQIIFPILMH